ncbi:hypothetical protein DFP93_12647 [Aneurinibacillus soli]|uniref:Uncharacterized protein n=1 Tax=Aneurinibacillus soli TaxID=1500254 RepID=A0A0U5C354_9BACL|nr:hypothetical protein [Aneurinibacillus soli]PYE58070.1 hypothetical protein DFP93_12647 [Aneurinibacillus soli]BAU25971.1 hypothetical protein CB4_00022 [Aneurinibacillus soli]
MNLFRSGNQIFIQVKLQPKQGLAELLSTALEEIKEQNQKYDVEIIQVVKETKQKYTLIMNLRSKYGKGRHMR